MNIIKKIGYAISSIFMLGMIALPVIQPAIAVAADAPQLKLSSSYPSLTGIASTSFTYYVDLQLVGGTDIKYFNLTVKGPAQYTYSITETAGGTNQIASIKLDPANNYPDTVLLTCTPNSVQYPTPGDYTFTFQAVAPDMQGTLDLKASVTNSFGLVMQTPDGVLSTKMTANKDNVMTLQLINTGTGDLTNIALTSAIVGSPSNWSITFDPPTISSLAGGGERDVKVHIKPPEKTITGDYQVDLVALAAGQSVQTGISIRAMVQTESIWGWLGVAVVVLVVAGLLGMFWYLGRR